MASTSVPHWSPGEGAGHGPRGRLPPGCGMAFEPTQPGVSLCSPHGYAANPSGEWRSPKAKGSRCFRANGAENTSPGQVRRERSDGVTPPQETNPNAQAALQERQQEAKAKTEPDPHTRFVRMDHIPHPGCVLAGREEILPRVPGRCSPSARLPRADLRRAVGAKPLPRGGDGCKRLGRRVLGLMQAPFALGARATGTTPHVAIGGGGRG